MRIKVSPVRLGSAEALRQQSGHSNNLVTGMLIVFRGFQEVKTVRKEQILRPQHNCVPPGRERDKGNCRPTIAENGRQLRRCSGSSSTKRIKDSEEYSRRSHSFHGPFGLCSMFRSRRIPAKLTRGDCAQKPEIALVLTRQLRNLLAGAEEVTLHLPILRGEDETCGPARGEMI